MDFNLWKDLNDGKNVIALISLKYPRIGEKIREKPGKMEKIQNHKIYLSKNLGKNCIFFNAIINYVKIFEFQIFSNREAF